MTQSQAMLSVKPDISSSETAKVTAHLLPCRIQHDGAVEPVQSFWDPTVGEGKLLNLDSKHEMALIGPIQMGPAPPISVAASCRARR